MSETPLETTAAAVSPIAAAVDAQVALVHALENEAAKLSAQIRNAQLPRQVGMAAAGRALSDELAQIFNARVDADFKSGALAARLEEAMKRAGEGPMQAPSAVAFLLVEQARAAARYVASRAESWAAEAYRLEGHAQAHEAQANSLAKTRQVIARSRFEAEAEDSRQHGLRETKRKAHQMEGEARA